MCFKPIFCLTAAAGTDLAGTKIRDHVHSTRISNGILFPKSTFEALYSLIHKLGQSYNHCPRFLTAAKGMIFHTICDLR
jgi:hypothetical protein